MKNSDFVIALVVSLAMLGGGIYLAGFTGDTVYEYQVKGEQVEADAGYNGTAVPIDNLSDEHRAAIFEAYEESDHFLDGASAHIRTDEPLNLTREERWQVVSIEGVRVLVGIRGPETYTEKTVAGLFGAMLIPLGTVGVLGTVAHKAGDILKGEDL